MSSHLPGDPVPAWGPVMRASAALVSLIVTFVMALTSADEVDAGLIVGFVTSLHASAWHLVGEVWKLRHKATRRGVDILVACVTAGGLGGAALGFGGCTAAEFHRVRPCIVEASSVAGELGLAVVRGDPPMSLGELAARALSRVWLACVEVPAENPPACDVVRELAPEDKEP